MSVFYDSFDWLGGLPFEVAKPEAILRFYRSRGFELRTFVTAEGGRGTISSSSLINECVPTPSELGLRS